LVALPTEKPVSTFPEALQPKLNAQHAIFACRSNVPFNIVHVDSSFAMKIVLLSSLLR